MKGRSLFSELPDFVTHSWVTSPCHDLVLCLWWGPSSECCTPALIQGMRPMPPAFAGSNNRSPPVVQRGQIVDFLERFTRDLLQLFKKCGCL